MKLTNFGITVMLRNADIHIDRISAMSACNIISFSNLRKPDAVLARSAMFFEEIAIYDQ
jgi:hypothetical protein